MQSEFPKIWNRREILALGLVGATSLIIPRHLYPDKGPRIVYSPEQSEKNLIVSVGDSIARGGVEPVPVSPADLIASHVNTQPGKRWEVLNLAQVGVTTREVIKHQLLDPKLSQRVGDTNTHNIDLIVHTGANDIGRRFAGDEQKVKRVRDDLKQPSMDIIRLAILELWDAMAEFKDDYSDFLEAANILFGQKIRHLIVISPPDFSQAPRINTYTNGQIYSFPLDNPLVQLLVKEGCRELRARTSEAVQEFSPFASFIIPTEEISRSHFIGDQHLNRQGNLIIARNFLSRTVLT